VKITIYRGIDKRTIVTKYDPPPIPDRNCDWIAWIDETLYDGSMVGRGRTEIDAIRDLLEQMNDRGDERRVN
jgi:hypothetical protein